MTKIPGGVAYLATPYSRYKPNIEAAFKDAAKIAARLLITGLKVYSPICHTHPIAIYGALDALDHSIWLPFDEAMMEAAEVLIVAHMEGWDESRGVAHEIKFFEDAGKPIFDLDPETMVMAKRRRPVEVAELIADGFRELITEEFRHAAKVSADQLTKLAEREE